MELWTDEYFLDLINRYIKHQIQMYFHVHHNRFPTKEEYEKFFKKWYEKLRCKLTNYDLGIFDE
jgi:hypothetical protein